MSGRITLFWRLSRGSFRRHKARWGLTVLGVAIGISCFTSARVLSRSVADSFEESIVKAAGSAQLQVSNGTAGLPADLVDVLRRVPGVVAAGGVVEQVVWAPELDRRLTLLGVPMGEDASFRDAQVGPGAVDIPDELVFVAQPDSVALTASLLAETGSTLGRTIEVRGPKGRRELVVRGTVASGGALGAFGGALGVMDAEALQQAFGSPDRYDWIDVVTGPDEPLDVVRARVAAAVGDRGVVDTPLGRGARMDSMLRTLRTLLTLTGAVATLVGAFLVYHTVATAVAERADDLLTLWALGTPRGHIRAYLGLEAAAIGTLGAFAGFGGGVLVAAVAGGLFGQVIGEMYARVPPPGVALHPSDAVVAFGLGITVVVLAAIVPLRRMLRRGTPSPGGPSLPAVRIAAAAIAAVGLALGAAWGAWLPAPALRVTAVTLAAALIFLASALVAPLVVAAIQRLTCIALPARIGLLHGWAFAHARRRPIHTAITIGSLAAGVGFALGLAILLGSYRDAFGRWLARAFVADVIVSPGATVSLLGGPILDSAVLREIEDTPGVRAVMPWRLLEVQLRGQPIIVQGMSEVLIDRAHPDLELKHDDGVVVISDTLAERYGFEVGDTLSLPAPYGALTVTVGAVAPDYVIDLGNVKLGWRLFTRHFGDSGANALLVDAVDGDADGLKSRLDARLKEDYDALLLTQDQLRVVVDSLLDRSFALTHALELLAGLVVICAMVNATSANVLDRQDEMTTLRALGLPRRRLARLLGVEAGVVGGVGGLLGLAAGALLGVVYVTIVARAVAGFRLPLVWPFGSMAALTILAVVAAAGSAWAVARRWKPRLEVDDAGAI